MTKYKRLILIGVIVLVLVVLDQGSKYLAMYLLEGKGLISLYHDCLRFVLAHNRGGFLSLGAALSEELRILLFVFVTSVFLLVFFFYTIFDSRQSTGSLVASAMIIGGGVGNLIDRILHDGAVVDFVNVGIGSLRTGVFNFADMVVLGGCLLLVWCLVQTGAVKDSRNE